MNANWEDELDSLRIEIAMSFVQDTRLSEFKRPDAIRECIANPWVREICFVSAMTHPPIVACKTYNGKTCWA